MFNHPKCNFDAINTRSSIELSCESANVSESTTRGCRGKRVDGGLRGITLEADLAGKFLSDVYLSRCCDLCVDASNQCSTCTGGTFTARNNYREILPLTV